jgi:hypothetical protein
MEQEMPDVGTFMSAGTQVTLDNAGLFLAIWAMTGLPPQILGFVLGLTTGLGDQNSIKEAVAAQNWAALAPLAGLTVVGMAMGLLGYAATVLLSVKVLRGQAPSSAGALVLEGLGAIVRVVVASILVGLSVGFGFILLFLPGVYLMVRLSMAGFAVIADERGPVEAYSQSWAMTSGRFMNTFGFMALLLAVTFGGMLAVVAAGAVLKLVLSGVGPVGGLVAGLAGGALQFLVSAWASATMTKYYLELSARAPKAG